MSATKAFASLSPTLLARKGGARPAMRQFEDSALQLREDDPVSNDLTALDHETSFEAEIFSINGRQANGQDLPEVLHQQKDLAHRIAKRPAPRRSALAEGRRAAFTLRIDADRHLKLRLASTITNQSAQQLVTEALDKLLEAMPDIETLAANVRKRR